jgi:hypothetical protein
MAMCKAISFSKSRVPADVEIVIFDKTYHLHSTILRQFSGFFDASLSDIWWKAENNIHGHPIQGIRYRYELRPDKGGDLMLVPVGMDVSLTPLPAPTASHTHNFLSR